MSTSVLVAKERQPGSPFGLRQKQAKKAQKTKKYGANAPQLHAIRCPIDFCVICVMLCNEQAKKQKNTAQMRHSCALFDVLSIFVQCSATRQRSTRSRLGFRALLLCAVPQQQLVWPPKTPAPHFWHG